MSATTEAPARTTLTLQEVQQFLYHEARAERQVEKAALLAARREAEAAAPAVLVPGER